MIYVRTLENFKKFFTIKELVSEKVYKKYGEKAWEFFDPRLLEVLIWIRKGTGLPITINTWASGGRFGQRGLRSNMDESLVEKTKAGQLYCSAHTRGQGVDFDVKGMTAASVRNWIKSNAEDCPYRIRLEKDVTWVHLDVCNVTDKKIVEFSA